MLDLPKSPFLLSLEKHRLNELNANMAGRNLHISQGVTYGPFMCDCYVVEYCVSGGMNLIMDGKTHAVSAGQLYLVSPYTSIEKYFTAPSTATVWVAVGGVKLGKYFTALGFSPTKPLFPVKLTEKAVKLLNQLADSFEVHEQVTIFDDAQPQAKMQKNHSFSNLLGLESDLNQASILCAFLTELVRSYGAQVKNAKTVSAKSEYVNEAIRYMDANYSRAITVAGIAEHLGITRNYLFTVFREQTGMAVHDYLTRVRMNTACEFLRSSDAMVRTVAVSVGYDPLTFSRAFKKYVGVYPTQYRCEMSGKGR